MSLKRKLIEEELSRFEAEISNSNTGGLTPTSRSLFVPNQVRPIIAANTYHQVQQKLQQNTKVENERINHTTLEGSKAHSVQRVGVPAPTMAAPTFLATFVPTQVTSHLQTAIMGKVTTTLSNSTGTSNSTTTPIILSSAPKLYQARQNVTASTTTSTTSVVVPPPPPAQVTATASAASSASTSATSLDVTAIQFDVMQKLKKLKAEKAMPNPIAEEAIKAARASSALQTFQTSTERKKKDRKTIRVAGGQVWEDPTLNEWPEDDFRIFCGDLGNDVNDELLTRTFNKFPSFQKARVIRDKRTGKSKGFGFVSFRDPQDFIKAMKEMDGRYVGSRPIKLRKSTWRQRSLDVVKKKEREKQQLLQQFQNN